MVKQHSTLETLPGSFLRGASIGYLQDCLASVHSCEKPVRLEGISLSETISESLEAGSVKAPPSQPAPPLLSTKHQHQSRAFEGTVTGSPSREHSRSPASSRRYRTCKPAAFACSCRHFGRFGKNSGGIKDFPHTARPQCAASGNRRWPGHMKQTTGDF